MVSSTAFAADSSAESRGVARVDGEAITAREVDRELDRVVKDRQMAPGARQALWAETLQQLINRRLVMKYLAERKQLASKTDVDLEFGRLRKRLEKQRQSLTEYLEDAGLTEAELRQTMTWQISWQRCLERQLTDANLERYFDQHRRDFDGTKLRVAHILFKLDPPGDASALSKTTARAQQVRQELDSGALSFGDAARKYSAAPTANSEGDLGVIARREPMPEAFSQAAFKLEKGQVSEPVATAFGVHLIRCLDVEPGKGKWSEVRGDLERAVTQYLFQWMADRQRPKSKVERTE